MRQRTHGMPVLLTAVALALAGCSSGGAPRGTGLQAAVAPTGTADCAQQDWPRAIPVDIVGQPLDVAGRGELRCYALARAVAPDGHDVLHDAAAGTWTISRVDPVVGTAVAATDPITLYVIATHATATAPTIQ